MWVLRQSGRGRGEARAPRVEAVYDLATTSATLAPSARRGRELRRRVPHPGFNNGHSVFVMMLPMEQTMGRGM